MNSGILIGMLTGIFVGALLSIVILIACNKDRKLKTEYDERQQLIRGKGYKYGFYTMMGAIVLLIILKVAEVNIPIHDAVVLFFIIALGISETVTYDIMHDAYFGLNNKINSYLIAFGLIAMINVLVVIGVGMSGNLVQDGVLGLNGMNLICAMMLFWIFIVMMIKKLSDEKGD